MEFGSPTSSDSASTSSTASSAAAAVAEGRRLARMAGAVRTLLECLGEDPDREGLVKTPMRMAKALVACTQGYGESPRQIVSDALFDAEGGEEMVIVRNIAIHSMCEHHMLPFYGSAAIGYLPKGKVVGLSKLARLADCFARRLQIQERLTHQIAAAVDECVDARGVAVCVECCHLCMSMRGVEKPGATTLTWAFTGEFKQDRGLRTEFMAALAVRVDAGAGAGAVVGARSAGADPCAVTDATSAVIAGSGAAVED